MYNSSFDGTDDTLDSRDIIERIEEWEALLENMGDSDLSDKDRAEAAAEFDGDEYDALKALAEDAGDYLEDWEDGAFLIAEDYFTEYCMELLSDTGYLPEDLPRWIVLDAEATAENMKEDYTDLTFNGTTYYARV